MVPVASGSNKSTDPAESDLARAFDVAIDREARQFSTAAAFPARQPDMPSINDVICVGRTMLEATYAGAAAMFGAGADRPASVFSDSDIRQFRAKFKDTGCRLQTDGTDVAAGRLHWSISPRKLRSLYKIALAHALVTGDGGIRGAGSARGDRRAAIARLRVDLGLPFGGGRAAPDRRSGGAGLSTDRWPRDSSPAGAAGCTLTGW